MKPNISIILSTYNNEEYLAQTIQSVVEQKYTDWELIIINDGSSDSTDKIIKDFSKKEKRIVYIKHTNKKGIPTSLNEGIKQAKGQYIARIDGDDLWLNKNKLQKQIDFLEKHKDHVLVGTWAKAINREGEILFPISYPFEDHNIRNILLKHNCFIHSSMVGRMNEIKKMGGYNVQNLYAQDYYLALSLGKFGKLHNIPEYMVGYRLNPNGISQTKYKLQNKETIKIIKKFKNDYPNFTQSFLLWNMRRYYPMWLRFGNKIRL